MDDSPKMIVDPAVNPDPYTVSVKPGVPAAVNAGETRMMIGAGLEAVMVYADEATALVE
jgi:hypothetical protein